MPWVPRRSAPVGAAPAAAPSVIRPRRLEVGDTIGLVAPANATFLEQELQVARETFEAFGLRVKVGRHLLDRYGYFAGTDESRAADVNAAFADPEVDAVFALRGGWGSARLLPRLDYDLIRRHPKILMGYSDVTALLLAIHARTGLVTFHGPVGVSTWTPFSIEHMAARPLRSGRARCCRTRSSCATASSRSRTASRRSRPAAPAAACSAAT